MESNELEIITDAEAQELKGGVAIISSNDVSCATKQGVGTYECCYVSGDDTLERI